MHGSGVFALRGGEGVSRRHCEEQRDEAIQTLGLATVWIASLRSQWRLFEI
jgi:hypothetical protein